MRHVHSAGTVSTQLIGVHEVHLRRSLSARAVYPGGYSWPVLRPGTGAPAYSISTLDFG